MTHDHDDQLTDGSAPFLSVRRPAAPRRAPATTT